MRNYERPRGSHAGAPRPAARTAQRATLRRAAPLLAGDAGMGMVELVIAIALTGIIFTAILGGISQMVVSARQQNVDTTAEAVLTQSKQAVENAPYSAAGSYPGPGAIPAGVTAATPSAAPVSGAAGLQAVTVRITVAGTTRTAIVYKSSR